MIRLLSTRLAVAVGGLALSLTAGTGVASADPVYGPMVDTTCSYDQAMASVHAENPMAAQYLDRSPPNLEFLRIYLGSSPDQRVNLLNQIRIIRGRTRPCPFSGRC